MKTRASLAALLPAIILTLTGGCARHSINAPLIAHAPAQGYRFANIPATTNSDELFVIVALSGGGTRASAFAFGAFEELNRTKIPWHGSERTLLDEVDIVSSVSGGSFTAAYYGLWPDRLLEEFPDRFLYRNVTMALGLRVLNPLNWFRLASPNFDRIDLAAEYYDQQVFRGKTFGDLAAIGKRPFVVLNATDMSLVSRFEFTQDQFDVLGADLSSYPVARGVAASSAFPILLCPLTLRNYPKPANYKPPGWLEDALSDRQIAPREFAYATAIQSYLDTTNRPYIHLLDGGLADNIGLRGPAYALTSVQNLWSLKFLLNTKIKYLVVITVNAKTAGPHEWDLRERAPGIGGMFSVVSSGPMGNYSDETVQYVQDSLETWRQEIAASRKIAELSGGRIPQLPDIKFYHLEASFINVPDPGERRYLTTLPTTFNLPRQAIDHLRAAAADLIRNSSELERLREDLRQEPVR